MIGYGPPADPGQLPSPGDEDHERRAAEEYAARRRVRRRMGWIALVAVCAVALVVVLLVAHPW
jgi:ferric-dicitrate binding protein FerR (iron transport regulator)